MFAAASLPVSANTQGTYLNQVFIGMFRPESSGFQRWVGNLKQYQFIFESTSSCWVMRHPGKERRQSEYRLHRS